MIKNLSKTFIKFLNATSILITVISLFLICTIFNKQYLINLLEKENYYQKLETEITEELSYYVIQSGLDETILDNLFNQKELKIETLEIINAIFNNNNINIDTKNFQENLNNNILKYLENKNITNVLDSDIESIVNKLTSVYQEKINYHGFVNKIINPFNKLRNIVIITLITFLLTSIFLSVISIKYLKENNIPVSCYLIFLTFIGLLLSLKTNIDINNLIFYNQTITNIIKTFVNNIYLLMIIIAIISFILGTILIILKNSSIRISPKYKKYLKIVLLIAWMIVIFNFSNQNASNSTNLSNNVTTTIVNIESTLKNVELTTEKRAELVKNKSLYIRKLAHFTEFMILGILVLLVIKDYRKLNKKYFLYALLFCFIYAISDELHQLFIDNRSTKILDVLIDTAGSLIGITLTNILLIKNKAVNSHSYHLDK